MTTVEELRDEIQKIYNNLCINEVEELDDLFRHWHIAQKNIGEGLRNLERKNKRGETCKDNKNNPKKPFKEYFDQIESRMNVVDIKSKDLNSNILKTEEWFFPDGIVVKENRSEYDKQSVKILYVLKETTAIKQISEGKEKDALEHIALFQNAEDFGLKRDILDIPESLKELYKKICGKTPEEIRKSSLIYKKIFLMHAYLIGRKIEDYSNTNVTEKTKDVNFLRENPIAYINLNKLGGGSLESTFKLCDYYCEIFSPFIKKEIEIIAPNIIVCCGTYHYIKEMLVGSDKKYPDKKYNNTVAGFIDNKGRKIIKIWHPSYRKSYKNYMAEFIKRFKTM